MSSKNRSRILIAFMFSLTLGLAPFSPEPHLIGKLKWLIGGAKGMALMDYWDLILHSAPWLALIYFIGQAIFQKK